MLWGQTHKKKIPKYSHVIKKIINPPQFTFQQSSIYSPLKSPGCANWIQMNAFPFAGGTSTSSCQNVTLSLMFSLLPVTTARRSPPQRPPWTQGNEWRGGDGCWRGVSWGCHGAEVLFARESRPTGPLLALAVSQAPPEHKKSI